MTDKAIHPAASILPLMVGDEFAALILDIKAHGQREPIVLHPDGSILDGRNRYRACEKAGIEPRYATWGGPEGTEVAYVISENLHRRHLDASQRAMFFARFATIKQGHKPKAHQDAFTIAQAAEAARVGERTIDYARTVINSGDEEMMRAVEQGEVPVKVAARLVAEEQEQSEPSPERRNKNGARLPSKEKWDKARAGNRERLRYLGKLNDALELLIALPAPEDFISAIPPSSRATLQKRVPAAIKWLENFEEKWSTHESARKQSSAA